MSSRVEEIADEIMLKADEMLTGILPEQREEVIGLLDEVYQIRLDTKGVGE